MYEPTNRIAEPLDASTKLDRQCPACQRAEWLLEQANARNAEADMLEWRASLYWSVAAGMLLATLIVRFT